MTQRSLASSQQQQLFQKYYQSIRPVPSEPHIAGPALRSTGGGRGTVKLHGEDGHTQAQAGEHSAWTGGPRRGLEDSDGTWKKLGSETH